MYVFLISFSDGPLVEIAFGEDDTETHGWDIPEFMYEVYAKMADMYRVYSLLLLIFASFNDNNNNNYFFNNTLLLLVVV